MATDGSGVPGGRGLTRGPSIRFRPDQLRVAEANPSPLARRVLQCLVAFVACAVGWAALGRLDIVAVADGRLVPRVALPVVQPAEGGVVREIAVGENEVVAAGQVLMRLDPAISDAETRALSAELGTRVLQLRRIRAELDETPLQREPQDDARAFAQALEQCHANRTAHADAVAQETAQRDRIGQELRAATAVADKLARTVPLYRTAADRFEQLRREGFVSELYALERDRDRIEKEHDQRAQEHTVAGLRASLEQAERRLAQVRSTYRAQLHAERAQADSQRARLAEELAKQLVRAERIELRAPQAGIVKELATHTKGAVVGAGALLLTLVPTGEELQAEVVVRHGDIGFVREGQTARVKLAPYPFQKYGLIDGVVVRVSPDSSDGQGARREAGADPVAGDAGVPGGYRARIALAAQSLAFDGATLPLASGMLAAAEIRLGERTLLEYLLAPVRRAWHEAGRER